MALARDPNHAWAMYNLGVALQRMGEHEAAIAQYKLAVERDSTLLTPEMQDYLRRKEPRRLNSEINMQGSPPSSTPR
jgi:tetratricopeptide (TPR) repeat protein